MAKLIFAKSQRLGNTTWGDDCPIMAGVITLTSSCLGYLAESFLPAP
jgi:hypothetical protein